MLVKYLSEIYFLEGGYRGQPNETHYYYFHENVPRGQELRENSGFPEQPVSEEQGTKDPVTDDQVASCQVTVNPVAEDPRTKDLVNQDPEVKDQLEAPVVEGLSASEGEYELLQNDTLSHSSAEGLGVVLVKEDFSESTEEFTVVEQRVRGDSMIGEDMEMVENDLPSVEEAEEWDARQTNVRDAEAGETNVRNVGDAGGCGATDTATNHLDGSDSDTSFEITDTDDCDTLTEEYPLRKKKVKKRKQSGLTKLLRRLMKSKQHYEGHTPLHKMENIEEILDALTPYVRWISCLVVAVAVADKPCSHGRLVKWLKRLSLRLPEISFNIKIIFSDIHVS